MKKRISRVVTKTGDTGTTSLADGTRIPKTDARMHAIGTIDELNSFIGVLLSHIAQAQSEEQAAAKSFLTEVQQSLFDLGGALAFPEGESYPPVEPLDRECARLNQSLPPLTEFVLPRGPAASSAAHVCRTVCRRAERCLWELPETTQPGAQYLNRLSDYFFVLARSLNQAQGSEQQWRGPSNPS